APPTGSRLWARVPPHLGGGVGVPGPRPGANPKPPENSPSLSRDLDPAAPPLRAQLPQGGEDQDEQLRSQTPGAAFVVQGIEMTRVPPYPTGIEARPGASTRGRVSRRRNPSVRGSRGVGITDAA